MFLAGLVGWVGGFMSGVVVLYLVLDIYVRARLTV